MHKTLSNKEVKQGEPSESEIILRIPNTVEVSGNVGLEGLVKYRDGENVSYYLDRVGGMRKDSEKKSPSHPA